MSENAQDFENKVRLLTGVTEYPQHPPFDPDTEYPEFRKCDWARKAPSKNSVYSGVREILFGMGLDVENYGTPEWNPFSQLVPPGGRVTVKPNMVRHWNEDENDTWQTVVTHWAVVRPLIDYSLLAVGKTGHVTVGDAPHWDCDIEQLKAQINIPAFLQHYDRTVPGQVDFVDFRPEYFKASSVVKCEPCKLPGDPAGYVLVDLKEDSMFADPSLDPKRFYGSGYDNRPTVEAHSQGRHQYLISGSALNCDLFINVPKLKTHHLLGLTVAMKNLVGINGDKNYLPHFRLGFCNQGGDQYPKRTFSLYVRYCILKYAMPILSRSHLLSKAWGKLLGIFHKAGGKNPYAGGGWLGNDTVWRMTLDLNRILLYAKKGGELVSGKKSRKYFTLVDGVIAGEGNGPMNVQARSTGVLLASGNPLTCDLIAAHIMGFDSESIKLFPEGSKEHTYPIASPEMIEQLDLASATADCPGSWEGKKIDELATFDFVPPVGWENMLRKLPRGNEKHCVN